MIEITIDTSRISSLNEGSKHDQIKYKYRIIDAEMHKKHYLHSSKRILET